MKINSIHDLKGLKFINNNNTLILDFQDDGVIDTNIICGISVIGKLISILCGIIVALVMFFKFNKIKSNNLDIFFGRSVKSIFFGLCIIIIGFILTNILNSVFLKENKCMNLMHYTGVVPYKYIHYTNEHFSIEMDLFSASKNYIKNTAKGDMVYGKVVFDNMKIPTQIGEKGFIIITIYQKSELMAFIATILYGLSSDLKFINMNGKSITMGYDVIVTQVPNISKQLIDNN
jgi:hypothetical protein